MRFPRTARQTASGYVAVCASEGRLTGLDERAARCVVAAAGALAAGRAGDARRHLHDALDRFSDHPEVLRIRAGIASQGGDNREALKLMSLAVSRRPDDALYRNTLGSILGAVGDAEGAVAAFEAACRLDPALGVAWYNLGVMLTRSVHDEKAVRALRRAIELSPDNVDARALLGDRLRMEGRVAESAGVYRDILARHPNAGMAWWGLADLRSDLFVPDDIDSMRAALRDASTTDDDRVAIGFALSHALDSMGQYRAALAALADAHAIARGRHAWDAGRFTRLADAATKAFTPPPEGASGMLGKEVVFIVGVPRSGSTLVEHILASHSTVQGAGELLDLPAVIAGESRRRKLAFPQWAGSMDACDWRRLGMRYLERTARWRGQRRRFTDKLPVNWLRIGAIRAMLPGAHIVVCRRDPLETCFSCYRQLMAGNEYTHTFADLASFWRDAERTATHFARLHPDSIYVHDHAELISNPERSIRQLLKACGLPFESVCLRFHETMRDVRSPSATQVRRPLYATSGYGERYGHLLDPLRQAFDRPSDGN